VAGEENATYYAVFGEELRYYTVRFINGTAVLESVSVPCYGNATYTGDTPTKEGEYAFTGWSPEPTNVTADMDCYAQFVFTALVSKKLVERTISGNYVNNIVKTIGNYAFYNCKALTTADFSAVTSIQDCAFQKCSELSTLILRNTGVVASMYSTTVLGSTKIANGNGYIYVPSALLDSYKSKNQWSTYSAQFRTLEDYTVDGTTTGALDPTKI
jgi:hypothetical protein